MDNVTTILWRAADSDQRRLTFENVEEEDGRRKVKHPKYVQTQSIKIIFTRSELDERSKEVFESFLIQVEYILLYHMFNG